LSIQAQAKKQKKPLNKSFVGSRGGFSKEPLAAGGIFARVHGLFPGCETGGFFRQEKAIDIPKTGLFYPFSYKRNR
jgi:hypothetical protein